MTRYKAGREIRNILKRKRENIITKFRKEEQDVDDVLERLTDDY